MHLLDKLVPVTAGRELEGNFRPMFHQVTQELALCTEMNDRRWGLSEARWHLDLECGKISFETQRRRGFAPVQVIGSYTPGNGIWQWAWGDKSLSRELSAGSHRLQDWCRQHGMESICAPCLRLTETECWELTALAFHLDGAAGAYRGSRSQKLLFTTYGPVSLSEKV